MTPPKVSVIVPVYNAEKYLGQCLDSLMAQTLKDVEYIFVNDGSTDGSLAILESYAARDDRIQIVTQENSGIGPAPGRNVGINLAKGDYLSILDDDDFFEPTLLEEAYNCAVTNDADVVMYSYWHYDNETEKISDYSTQGNLEKMPSDACSPREIAETFPEIVMNTAWSKLFRREFILREDIKFPTAFKFSDDTYFSHVAILTAKRVARLNKKLLYYRVNQTGNLGRKAKISCALQYEAIKALRAIRDTLSEKGIFSSFERGVQKLVKREIQYLFEITSVQDFSIKKRLKICREFDITVSPFAMFGMRIFLHDHSPQWFLRFERAVRQKVASLKNKGKG